MCMHLIHQYGVNTSSTTDVNTVPLYKMLQSVPLFRLCDTVVSAQSTHPKTGGSSSSHYQMGLHCLLLWGQGLMFISYGKYTQHFDTFFQNTGDLITADTCLTSTLHSDWLYYCKATIMKRRNCCQLS